MALLQNKSIQNQYPLRQTGGLAFSNRVNFGPQLHNHKNRFIGEASLNNKSSTPNGYNVDGSWLPAITAGELVSHSHEEGYGFGNDAVLAEGIPLDGDTTGSSVVNDAVLQLVVGLDGDATGTCTPSNPVLSGILQLDGDATGSCSFDADMGAIINMVGTATGSCSFDANLTGDAYMSGDVSPYTELSPQSLADAVWTFDTRELTAASSSSLTTEEHNQLMSLLKKSQFIALK